MDISRFFFFIILSVRSTADMASPKGLDANLSSLPKDPGNTSPMSDVASLVELMKTLMKAAEEREMRMASMLESALKPSADGRSQPVQVTSSPSTRAVSAERPMLLSSATLADFVSWEEAWTDYAKCQHLANQDGDASQRGPSVVRRGHSTVHPSRDHRSSDQR